MTPFCATFDIETSELHAVGLGQIICAVVLPMGGKPIVLRADTERCTIGNEQRLIRLLVKELFKYHLLIGQNSEDFDWAFIKSRAVQFGIPLPYPYPLSYDIKKAFKRTKLRTTDNGFGKPTASLDMMIDFYRLKQSKTRIYPNQHALTIIGKGGERNEAMEELVSHCIEDVRMTEALYYRVIRDDPNPIIRRLK